ncbi:8-amino-7-oxononanoate synthase [Desulfopila sp. IMCC35006]|uniref:aminotransferase class I/II-fold pyridoxal phosphate-dependent enzyme n=1 Tax=Desulfopila sp. IMCC35006 TaxID=2569542 RepID=UPI0010AC376F|nr:8-amino-7-oxononanoate synthase [Desulfopila sp. IMCC35006]TKB27712.1 8-amino-7-oxononanoate synthase [Desulfopila sp. IMCC35006]
MSNFYEQSLQKLLAEGRLREFKPLTGRSGCRIDYRGRQMLNLTSNDYLGLAGDKRLHEKFYRTMTGGNLLDDFGLGAASSRLLTGDSIRSHQLEQTVRETYNKEACLLFNSGYHANIGILPALLGKNDLILSDKLNHASIVDGMRLSLARHKRFRHCDYAHLAELLHKFRKDFHKVIIVSESVFSMDGDVADIAQIARLKAEYDCLLYLDEAHALGLYGPQGLGMAEEQGQLDAVDLLVGTFGKALASVGAFVLCSAVLRDYLINHSRSLIFTTALPPVVLHWDHFIFQEMLHRSSERSGLKTLSAQLRQSLISHGLRTDGATNIVPVLLGDDSLAVALAESMQERGYLIFPVRPPAVPEGTARFRLSLTADMHWTDIAGVAENIAQLMPHFIA